ncbi:MAG TPA: 2-hydroxychromene-2-carboxylate isomerase [Burkholderiales bacterium]|nr:2-hydroxychromene-2-carboxylate isomerase [Burkholderiales bacterium]
MPQSLDFYFDFSSPYGYFAATRIDALAARHGRDTVWHPILLGIVFKQTGGQPLPSIPIKGTYALRDIERTARWFGLPYRAPSRFPVSGTAASRAYYWIAQSDVAAAKRFALAVFHAYFAEDRDISSPEVVADVAAALGIDRAPLLDGVGSAPIKDKLREEVEAAMALGVFGSPYVIADGEPFWGSDRLDQLERWLATGPW